MWYAYAVGFGYAIIVGYLLIKPVMFIMWSYEDRSLKSRWQPALIGVIERILGLLPIEWATFKTYSAGNMQVRTLRRKYS